MNGRHELILDVEEAIAQRSMESRVASLQYVTDLFAHQAGSYSEEQVALFDDVISRLAAEIEMSARARLARVLAPIPNAPRTVIRSLAFDDEIDVASPVLSQSDRLDEADLIENAASKSQGHLLAISHRRNIGEAVTDILLTRGDGIVVLSTAKNSGARISEQGFTTLVQRAGKDDDLAAVVGTRPEIPRHQFLKLLTVASVQVRTRLEQANPQGATEIRRVVREVTIKTQTQSIDESFEYSRALKSIEQLSSEGQLDERYLVAVATSGKFEETVVALSTMTNAAIAVVEQALLQERTELLLSLLKSIGLSWPAAKQVLQVRMRVRPMSEADIEQCLANYERLKPKTAELVVRFHTKGASRG